MLHNRYINMITVLIISVVVLLTFSLMILSNTISVVFGKTTMEYEDALFQKDKIMQINIIVEPDEWQQMLDNAMNATYISCDVVINGTTFTSVGIRPKGNTSLSQVANDSTTDRYSFKLEFDHYITGQTCFGLDKLILNNMISDNTYMKEYLSYDLLTFMDIPSSLYAFSKIQVNGEDWGLYLALEGAEESYLQRNFGSDYGNLYKPESESIGGGMKDFGEMPQMNPDQMPQMNFNEMPQINPSEAPQTNTNEMPQVNPGEVPQTNTNEMPQVNPGEAPQMQQEQSPDNQVPFEMPNQQNNRGGMNSQKSGSDLIYTDNELESYADIFNNEVLKTTNTDKQKVITALQHLNEGADLETYINVDEVLRYFAVNTVLVNLDSYVSNLKHNYYLYEKDGQLSMLPWDYNLAFAGFQAGNATSAVNFPIDTPIADGDLDNSPMLSKLLEVPEYLEQYHQYLQQIIDDYFYSGIFTNTISMLQTLIDQEVANDPTAFCSYEEYLQGVDTLKLFGLLRAESIQKQLNGEIPSTSQEQNQNSSTLIDASSLNLNAMGVQGGGNRTGEVPTFESFSDEFTPFFNAQPSQTPQSENPAQSPTFERSQRQKNNPSQTTQLWNQTQIYLLIGYCIILLLALIFIITFRRRRLQKSSSFH